MQTRLKQHGFKVKWEKFKGDLKGKLFTLRMVVIWNKTPEYRKGKYNDNVPSNLDNYLDRKGIKGRWPNVSKWN